MTLTETNSTCSFCANPSVHDGKCIQHRYRQQCSAPHCTNQSYARSLCVQHGGRLLCHAPGCLAYVRSRGFCSRHLPGVTLRRTCNHPAGCSRFAHGRGLCAKHGGNQECHVVMCTRYARKEGFCQRHYRLLGSPIESTDERGRLSTGDADILAYFLGGQDDTDGAALENGQVDVMPIKDLTMYAS
ncbi:Aste57867_11408 [Aphanomyces stellatus]|uniref:Aste57867_11408 protein n=1 Tax=Aphanomyces stellatus TaxID=120398 RepID=A0A485KT84_9STRA|nr:hypothetical protein As57867_011366 [Aphanomyces stellatus]VFT88269.1 Aste57867_11408 [Aphanomyces stellatus]